MSRLPLVVAASLAVGLAAGAWFAGGTLEPVSAGGGPGEASAMGNPPANLHARLDALEQALDMEREARRILEDELLAIYAQIEGLQEAVPGPARAQPEQAPAAPAGPGESRSTRDRRRAASRREALVDAGFSAARADHIIERESALRYERMQAIYQARNSENPRERFEEVRSAEESLRAELGDADYERYLEATGQPTSVGVRSVMASSPAAVAGLQPGDRIVGYDGERVFGASELMMRVMKAGGGENVTIDVIRDGVPMQVSVPRGPIGIEITRRRGR